MGVDLAGDGYLERRRFGVVVSGDAVNPLLTPKPRWEYDDDIATNLL